MSCGPDLFISKLFTMLLGVYLVFLCLSQNLMAKDMALCGDAGTFQQRAGPKKFPNSLLYVLSYWELHRDYRRNSVSFVVYNRSKLQNS